jgi:hypothetical protein
MLKLIDMITWANQAHKKLNNDAPFFLAKKEIRDQNKPITLVKIISNHKL